MSTATRTIVTFQSDLFNKTEERDYFVNPGCFGDDVCRFVISKFKSAGIECDDSPAQENWGWYFYFHANGTKYQLCCNRRSDWPTAEEDNAEPCDEAWICFVVPHAGGFLSAFGIGKKQYQLRRSSRFIRRLLILREFLQFGGMKQKSSTRATRI